MSSCEGPLDMQDFHAVYDCESIHSGEGRVLSDIEDEEEQKQLVEELRARDPQTPLIALTLCGLCCSGVCFQDPCECREALLEVLPLLERPGDGHYVLGTKYFTFDEDFDEAFSHWNKGIALKHPACMYSAACFSDEGYGSVSPKYGDYEALLKRAKKGGYPVVSEDE